MPDHTEGEGNSWSVRAKWGLVAFATIGAFFLLAEHRAHVLPFFPWLILLACLLTHVFMHGGHGGHGGPQGGGNRIRGETGGPTGTGPDGSRGADEGSEGAGHAQHGGRS